MTADNFTDAARAEATSRARRVTPGDTAADWSERMLMMEQFRQGAEWARTHLAAQEPTDAEVGAVQKCLYGRTLTWVPTVEVRAALSAARAARRDEE